MSVVRRSRGVGNARGGGGRGREREREEREKRKRYGTRGEGAPEEGEKRDEVTLVAGRWDLPLRSEVDYSEKSRSRA